MNGTPFSAASGTGSSTASAGSNLAGEERGPFGPGEAQDRPARIPAVADADGVAGESGDLDAVAVGEAEGTLDPARVHLRTPLRRMLPWPGRGADARTPMSVQASIIANEFD